MKRLYKNIKFIFLIGILWCLIHPAYAGEIITIDSIDPKNKFPTISIDITVKCHRSLKRSELNDSIQMLEDGNKVSSFQLDRIDNNSQENAYLFLFIYRKSIATGNYHKLRSAANEIINHMRNGRIGVFKNNSDNDIIECADFTEDKTEITKSVNKCRVTNRKNKLYDSVLDSIEFFKKNKADKKSIIVFTDGLDSSSSAADDEIISAAKDSSISVIFVTTKKNKRNSRLNRIARKIGGKSFYISDENNLNGLLSFIFNSETGGKFRLGYISQIDPDNKDHTVELVIQNDDIRDRDTVTFTVTQGTKLIAGNSVIIISLLVIIIIFLVSLLIIVIIILKKNISLRSKRGHYNRDYHDPDVITRAIALEEQERHAETVTLSSDDPDYNYSLAWLLEKEGPQSGKKHPIHWDDCTIGKSRENSIIIDDPGVSPNHSKIKHVRNGYYIFDLISDNGTYLNGKKLLRPKLLNDWDEITLGKTTLIFRGSKKIQQREY